VIGDSLVNIHVFQDVNKDDTVISKMTHGYLYYDMPGT